MVRLAIDRAAVQHARMKRIRPLLLTLALLCGACGTYSPREVQIGQSRDEVLKLMGPPTNQYRGPDGGQRLEYARGPMGRDTFMVDLDASGHVLGWAQVLTQARFAQIVPGLRREDVLFALGRPSNQKRYVRQHEDVWSYRFGVRDAACEWFQVSLGDDGRVRSAGLAPDPLCDYERNVK
jgi:hypothetical protein